MIGAGSLLACQNFGPTMPYPKPCVSSLGRSGRSDTVRERASLPVASVKGFCLWVEDSSSWFEDVGFGCGRLCEWLVGHA